MIHPLGLPVAAASPLPDLRHLQRVLVVKPSSLGDIVHTLPAVAWLKENWPHLQVRWLANREWAPILHGSPLLEEVIEFPRSEFRGLRGLPKALAWWRRWRAKSAPRRPELALDFQGLLRSALLARGSGAPVIAGLSDAREGAAWLHTHRIPVDPSAHAVERYLTLVRAFTPATPPEAALSGDWLPAGVPPEGFVETDFAAPFLVLHPFSRGQGKSLGWEEATRLAQAWTPWRVVLVGRTTEPSPSLPPHVLDLVNRTTLPQLVWLLRRAVFVVSVDSGPMHLASALHRPLLGLHTWSDPRRVGPYSPEAWVWKGGQIVRRRDVTPELFGTTLAPDARALDSIAAWVKERLPAP